MNNDRLPYQERLNHPEDFKVKYRFYSESEGGRKEMPIQGLRSDFWYEDKNHTMKGNFIIWPEFENEDGELIVSGKVLKEGVARMWIINNESRPYHQERIKIGTKGYFMEGIRTGECEVIEIVGLESNPIINKAKA
ncbi:hypothetical protein [Aureibacter tunicatorum]|uniref:Uncharacterized protein n=1 Tax=Aureibacter tunicatorum TaxID=866807 RepID=A0AAE4BS61_9BACT|nr:hypothetical protein [Aureibacter tunicatorum]MDR6238543.1 hypothetical protein [Aureibacter tunicatorum]BDD05526.1 hypothetical protein AUTU_30090 [Aureibacter tunicatorum]